MMPKPAEPWSLTSLREKLIKIGAKVVSHGRYVTFQLAEVAVSRQMFAEILSSIARLRAGRANATGDEGTYLIPEPTFALLKAEGPLPVAIDTDVESYLAGRRAGLDREIEEVARLADQGKLDGVDLTGGELVISPVQASTPPEAEKVKEAAYALLPTSKITDVLLEVDSWTDLVTASRISATAGRRTTSRPCSRRSWPTASISASIAWPTRFGASPIGSSRWFTTGISGRRAIGRLSLG